MSNKPSVGLLVELISQNRLKMAKISYFSYEIQFSLNHISSEIFEILGVHKQMFISCGQDEPYRSSKKAYYSRVIGLYFLSFFYEHADKPGNIGIGECECILTALIHELLCKHQELKLVNAFLTHI